MKRFSTLALMLAACGEPLLLDQVTQPIANGAPDDEGAWPGVAILRNGVGGQCSGTLIHVDHAADRALVLTAAHCLFDPYKAHRWTGLVSETALMGPDQTSGMFGERVYLHPGARYDRYDAPGDPWPISLANDFAVVEVNRVHAGAEAWVLPVASEPVGVGTPITLVGYGRPNSGQRYLAENEVDAVGAFLATGAPYVQVAGERTPCSGDSGGPYLAEVDGSPHVVGVHFTSRLACGEAKQVSRAGGAEATVALIEAAIEGRSLAPATCLACAGAPETCPDTRTALLRTDIEALSDCINERAPGRTFARCGERFPEARAALEAHWACLETTCDGLCTRASYHLTLCEYGQDGGGPCDACLVEHCCEAAATCMNEPDCGACASNTRPGAVAKQSERSPRPAFAAERRGNPLNSLTFSAAKACARLMKTVKEVKVDGALVTNSDDIHRQLPLAISGVTASCNALI